MNVDTGTEMVNLTPEMKVKVKEVSIRGFKSFKYKSKIGPLSEFSCIVGPNGAGKSIIGEALGFVLGGSARNLRAKSLFNLLNEETRDSKQHYGAKVTVTLQVIGGHPFRVSRVISGSTISNYFLNTEGRKRQLSFSELKDELSKFGISAHITERFIIRQSRHAVKAKQPSELCEYLEVIFGSEHFKEMIGETDTEISEKFNENNFLQKKLAEVQSKIEVLQPEVEKWQSFNTKWHNFQLKKVSYLRSVEKSLRYKLQQNVSQKDIALAEHSDIKEKEHILQDLLRTADSQITDLNYLLVQRQKGVEAIEKHIAKVRSEELKLKVHLAAAKKDAEMGENEYLVIHQKRLAIENEVASLPKVLERIKEEKETLEQQREELAKNKPRLCSQGIDGAIRCDGHLVSAMEDAEDELSEKISKIHGTLSDIRKEIQSEAITASKVKDEIYLLEKRFTKMVEEKKKQEEDTAALQEKLQAEISESSKVSTKILNLKELLKRDELEVYKLRKEIESSQNRFSKISRVDKALEVLRLKLKEKFHGRLIDLAKVEDNMIQAANSIMSHLMNTSMTFVTEDRQTADEVIHHFQSERIGVVTCEILSESRGLYKQSCDLSELRQEQSVMKYLQCADVYKPIFWKYTKNWIILKDRDAAISYFRKKTDGFQQKNIVTIKGDIFKHDGEVIAAIKNEKHICSLQGCKNPNLFSTLNHENELKLVLDRWKVHKEEIVNYEIKMDTLRAKERELQKQVWKHEEASKNVLLSLLSSRLKEKKEMQSIIDAKAKKYRDEEAHLIGVMTDLENSRNHSILHEVQEWRRSVEILDVQIKNCELEMQRIQYTMNNLSHKMEREQSLSVELAGKKSAVADLEIRHSNLKVELEQKQMQRNEMTAEIETISQKILQHREEAIKHKTEIKSLHKKEVKIQKQLEDILEKISGMRDRLDRIINELHLNFKENQTKKINQDLESASTVNAFDGDDEDVEGVALAEEELRLNQLYRSIDPRTLDEDLDCKKEESHLLKKLDEMEEYLNSMKLRKESYENERFEIFRESVRKVNVDLARIYGELTKHGDAYLSFTQEKMLLFTEGVNFQVRPGLYKWCSFNSLSGGQQSLAALALSFSLQLQFPSPFYFFDEIDAALDTKTAQLVANYIKKQTQAQYIIVSHRPQLYEHASTMVGIYHCCGSSMSITAEV